MKKWQNLAPPDDPNSWYDVDGFWPTNRGSYESADFLTGATFTATSTDEVVAAWRGKTTSTSAINPRYIVDLSGKIWQFSGGALTDRTGAAAFGTAPRAQFAQYGSVTIAVLGSTRSGSITGGATVFTTAPTVNFAALAGAPAGESITIVSNAVLITNTSNKDGWAASDVGDYTNWSTNEAASGQIFFPAGPILSLVEFNGAGYAFKQNSIHRLRYVGGAVKWLVEKVFEGAGCGDYNSACSGEYGILFAGYAKTDTGSPTVPMYWYDGVNPPAQVNPLTEIPAASGGRPIVIVYHPQRDIFSIWTQAGVWYFAPKDMAFGKSASPLGASPGTFMPYDGNLLTNDGDSITTSCWAKSATNTLKLYSTATNVGVSYLETMKAGKTDRKTLFKRLTPILRRRVDAGGGTVALSVSRFREREDTSAASTDSVAESTIRKRFDFNLADNFARFKTTYTNFDIEIDDAMLKSEDAGED